MRTTNNITKYHNLQILLLSLCLVFACFPGLIRAITLIPAIILCVYYRKFLTFDRDLSIFLAIFVGYLVLFTIVSESYLRSVKGVYDILRACPYFLAAYLFGILVSNDKRYSILNVVAIFTTIGLLFTNITGPEGYWTGRVSDSVIELVLLFFIIPFFSNKQNSEIPYRGIYYILCAIAGTILCYLIFLGNIRSVWLGLVLASISFNLIFKFDLKYKIGLSVVVTICSLIVIVYFNSKGLSLSKRDIIWSGLFNYTIENSPWWGFGINNAKDIMVQQKLPELMPHNLFLEIFVSSGIVGICIFVVSALFLFKAFRNYQYYNNTIFWVGLLGFIAYATVYMFNLKMASNKEMGLLMLFLGLIYSQRKHPNRT